MVDNCGTTSNAPDHVHVLIDMLLVLSHIMCSLSTAIPLNSGCLALFFPHCLLLLAPQFGFASLLSIVVLIVLFFGLYCALFCSHMYILIWPLAVISNKIISYHITYDTRGKKVEDRFFCLIRFVYCLEYSLLHTEYSNKE